MMRYSLRKLGTAIRNAAFVIAVAGVAAGCATLPEDPLDRADVLAANDPFEPANRMVFL